MRHSQQEKARSHERIVEVAAERIRQAGTEAPGVNEIMTAAGLTHGGFYKHFASRDELIAEAAARACASGSERIAGLTDGADDPLRALLDGYLSAGHRDDPGSGCAITALGGDAAHSGNPVRSAYTAQVRRYIDDLRSLLPIEGGGDDDERARAIGVMSTLVGALTISRAVDDPALSDEILAAARRVLAGLT